MKSFLIFLALITYSFSLLADSEVSCWNGSCLKHGWSSYNFTTGVGVDNACYREGCTTDGWISAGGNQRTYTQCKGGGCFQEGRYELDSNTQIIKGNVICLTDNCLKSGWMTYSISGLQSMVMCLDGDCEKNGWTTQTPTSYSQTYCKDAGCFVEGWIEK